MTNRKYWFTMSGGGMHVVLVRLFQEGLSLSGAAPGMLRLGLGLGLYGLGRLPSQGI